MFLMLSSLSLDPLIHGQRSLSLWPIKDESNLFQRVALGLGEQEPHNDEHDEQQDAKDNVVVPADVLHADRVDELTNDETARVEVEFEGQTFGAQGVGEDFGRILSIAIVSDEYKQGRARKLNTYSKQQWCVGNVVVKVVKEEADHHHDTSRRTTRLGIDRRARSPDDIGHQHAGRRPQEQEASAESINQEGSRQRSAKVEDLQHAVDERLVKGAGDANRGEDLAEVVGHNGDTVPLRKEADANGNGHALPVSGSREQGAPGRQGRFLLHVNRLNHLGQLTRNQLTFRGRVVDPVEKFGSILNTVLCHEPTR